MKKIIATIVLGVLCLASFARTPLPTLAVLGDSYSTFQGYIPDGNEIWYFEQAQQGRTDVDDVCQTWWWQVADKGGFKLGANDSYSGATIGYTGYRGVDYEDRSFITRLPRLGQPDVLLIFGGTNDSWCGAPIGEYKYDGWTHDDMYAFRPAMARLLNDARKRYPNTEIYFILNSELKPEINESVRTVCAHYSIPCIELTDIDKIAGHPSVKGMEAIATQVLQAINR